MHSLIFEYCNCKRVSGFNAYLNCKISTLKLVYATQRSISWISIVYRKKETIIIVSNIK